MDSLGRMVDRVAIGTYDLLAVLLPGMMVVYVGSLAFGICLPGAGVGLVVSGYVMGRALQGFADGLYGTIARLWNHLGRAAGSDGFWKKRVFGQSSDEPTWIQLRNKALTHIRARLGKDFPEDGALDVCLSVVEAHRQTYDKFVALRDTARGLSIATLIISAIVFWNRWNSWTWPDRFGAVALAAVTFLCFIQRYRRFEPLGKQAVYGQFLATLLDPAAMRDREADEKPEP